MKRISALSITAVLAIIALVPAAWALTGQEPHPPTSLEIPFLEREPFGARWTAMGGAAIGAIDDGSAFAINPAGLGRIRRIEFLGTLQKQSYDVDANWFGKPTSSSISTTTLRELTLSFPFPTYRGSLVFSGSMSRRNVFDAFTVRSGFDPALDATRTDREERSGMLTSWGAGISAQVSPQAFVGLEGHGFTGSLDTKDEWSDWFGCNNAVFSSNTDLGGYGGSVGMQYQPIPLVGIGAVLKSPERVTLKGDLHQPVFVGEGAGVCEDREFSVDDEATLPYSMGVGISLAPANLLVNFDVVYTDWHELKYQGRVRDPNTGAYLYDPTTDLHIGVEYAFGQIPFRLRAGYARVPLEFKWFDVTKNRSSYSLGAGTVVESAVGFDVAWQRTSFERKSVGDDYSEERTIDRVVLTVAYRF